MVLENIVWFLKIGEGQFTPKRAETKDAGEKDNIFFSEGPVMESCFEEIQTTEKENQDTGGRKEIPSLKLTASLHLKMDGWKMNFLLGWPIFSGELLVSGSV